MPTSAAGTDTAACHQSTDRETGALISAASFLALTTTTQSAVACEVELLRPFSSELTHFCSQFKFPQGSDQQWVSHYLGPDLLKSA